MTMTFIHRYLGLAAATFVLAGCGATDSIQKAANQQLADGGIGQSVEALAKQCGIDVKCSAGIAQGNASISGVASVDAFFASVLNFQAKADHMSADIDAKLSAIRGDFGIDAAADLQTELAARIDANVEGGVTVRSEPARCAVDAKVALEAQAKCDATVDPGKVSMMCDGHCDVESNVDVDCGADAELHCTYSPPTGVCSGSCTGSCEVQVSEAAQCSGMCTGSCTGACSAYSDEAGTQCAGRCDGMCVGSCKIEMMTEASCSGSCTGECTVTAPTTMCESAIRAHCDAKATGMVACKGRCEGHCVPPKAKAECEASARAETKLNVECTPPRIVLDYTLKANADAEAQARFVAAIENLRVSLPSLFASFEQASSVSAAGVDLVSDAKVAVKAGVNAAGKAVVKGDLRTVFGLACAARELDNVGTAVKDSSDHLDKSIHDCTGVKSAIGAM